jgi:hypothetical protein
MTSRASPCVLGESLFDNRTSPLRLISVLEQDAIGTNRQRERRINPLLGVLEASKLAPVSLYASVGSLNRVGNVDFDTSIVTAVHFGREWTSRHGTRARLRIAVL